MKFSRASAEIFLPAQLSLELDRDRFQVGSFAHPQSLSCCASPCFENCDPTLKAGINTNHIVISITHLEPSVMRNQQCFSIAIMRFTCAFSIEFHTRKELNSSLN